MKIAVNTRLLLANKLEGMGWFTHEVLRHLVASHPEHEFLFFFDRPFDEQFIFGDNVKGIVLFPPARHPFLFIAWFEWSLARALREHQPDVFLSPDNFLSLRSKVPTVLVTHDIAHHHFPNQVSFLVKKYYQYFIPKFLRRANHILAVSNYTKKDIQKVYDISPAKISLTCNGCRTAFQPLDIDGKISVKSQFSDGADYFFYVGAIHPRKNVPRLMKAFDQFKQETNADVKLLLAGRMAWQTGEVKQVLETLEYSSDIKFLGYLSDEDLPKVTAGALASTYVSLFEGFGIPILEAMHCEVPVITSNTSSMPEIAGEAAILVNPENVREIATAMETIYEKEAFRLSLIEKGKIQRRKYSWEKAAQAVYNALLKIQK